MGGNKRTKRKMKGGGGLLNTLTGFFGGQTEETPSIMTQKTESVAVEPTKTEITVDVKTLSEFRNFGKNQK